MTFAMVFPGQGSQAVGMLDGWDHPAVAATLAEADEALGWSLSRLVAQGPEAELNRTDRTQPALLAASISIWRVWLAEGGARPVALAGHSLGEYSALVAAEALAFGDALRLVERRGQLMQAAVPEGQGGMVAVIGLEDAAVEALCAQCPVAGVLAPVNYNAPGQVVVAGATACLDWLEANGKAAGARMLVKLPVSVPSHCALMQPAAEALAESLAAVSLSMPVIPVLHNVDAQPRSDLDGLRGALAQQLHQPVRWSQTLQALHTQGVSVLAECGPGKVLAGLAKRTLKGVTCHPLETADALQGARNTIASH
jgi:[acyl-carrier-protein] S-malonyltransferase